MDKETAIRVENVSKTFRIPHEKISTLKGAFVSAFHSNGYEEFKALDDVSFEVKKGEFFGIIGRNGSGKSTLLKILAGIYKPDKGGKVSINGRISPFLELGIGFNPELSGRDNIYLNATVLGLTRKQIDEKFDDIVEFSELRRFIDQKVKNYSSGMSVRLAFSVAIHANRDILLMDEVLAVGDSNFQSKCLSEFNKYRGLGKTVILVTHDILTVQKYCDRVMLLRDGKIVMVGKPDVVSNEYIRQNMTDEDKRMLLEERVRRVRVEENLNKGKIIKSQPEIKIEKKASVAKVDFLGKDGKEKKVFETGELLVIKVEYYIGRSLLDPIFGIIIRNEMGTNVFGLNTDYKKIKIGNIERGKKIVSFFIKNYFSTGDYTVSPAVAESTQQILDWRDNMKKFQVINHEFTSKAVADFESNIIIS